MPQNYIPRFKKQIQDVIEKKQDDDESDSSIDEPDIDRDIVNLNEFEQLFRVSPTVDNEGQEQPKCEFKIQRKAK